MKRLIESCRTVFTRLTSPEPAARMQDAGRFDWVPPSLSASDLCSSLLADALDHGSAWYFDRPEPGPRRWR